LEEDISLKKLYNYLILATTFVCMVILLSACGAGRKDNQNVSATNSSQDETIMESSGENVQNIDFGENIEWPKELMANLPEPKGKVTAVINDESTGSCTIAFAEMSKEDAMAYVDKIKELGYTNGLNVADGESIMAGGTETNGAEAFFTYNITAKEGTISYSSKSGYTSEQPEETTSTMTDIAPDMTDIAPWPNDFFTNLPELDGKIVNVFKEDNQFMGVDLEFVDKSDFEAYVGQLKQNGFTVEAEESISTGSIDYRAYNGDGVWIHAYLNIMEEGNSATIEMEKAAGE
jgi:hypothetical protein